MRSTAEQLTLSPSAPPATHKNNNIRKVNTPWAIAIASLIIMYLPSFWDLFTGIWATSSQGHGPIVLGISIWLLWRKWPRVQLEPDRPTYWAGWVLFSFGILLFFIGRSQDILMLEMGALAWLIAACTLLLNGFATLKIIRFPLCFLLLSVPLPGSLIDALTQPMKIAVSYGTEELLEVAGYPISRTGVILQMGQYQLLVADACAGLQTLFTLEALGLLYLNLTQHKSRMRNSLLATLIIPISYCANVIRVVTLCLITYYFGDEAGQGFLHSFAGLVLFLAALLLIIIADDLISRALRITKSSAAAIA